MRKGWYPVIDYDKYVGHMVCSNMCRHGGDNTAHLPAVHAVEDALCHCKISDG